MREEIRGLSVADEGTEGLAGPQANFQGADQPVRVVEVYATQSSLILQLPKLPLVWNFVKCLFLIKIYTICPSISLAPHLLFFTRNTVNLLHLTSLF